MFTNIKTLVVKLGTSLLSGETAFKGLVLEALVKDMAKVKRERDLDLLVVSSGAMGCGMERLGMKNRPATLPIKQATAAVGQSRLMHFYEALFQTYGDGLQTAQILLSAKDLDDRRSYLNVRNTINALFDFSNVIPIVNENDSVTTEELRFGDNDTLSAKIASKIGADLLIILSNVDGLFETDPSVDPDAKLIAHVDQVTSDIESLATGTRSTTAIGGMHTKLMAAKIACTSGTPMVIANGNRPNAISSVLDGTIPMTAFGKSANALSHRKRWIAFGRSPRGYVQIDDGARDALLRNGKSLLPAGITEVGGDFEMGEAIVVRDSAGHNVARGLTNYASHEVARIKGRKSGDIASILGYKDFDVVIHRNNLVLL
jgi:glutamate 5-kinase